MPAAAFRGLAKSGSPALLALAVDPLERARGRYTSPRTSSRPAGASRSAQRDRADRADVRRDVLAADAVAARHAAHEPAVLVGERDAEAVDLQLGDVGDRAAARPCVREAPAHALVERAQLLLAVGVVEAEHRRRGARRCRTPRRAGPPTRCVGESGVTRSGCSRLERLELLHQRVELGVRDLGVVEDVVALFVMADAGPEVGDAFGWSHAGRQSCGGAWRVRASASPVAREHVVRQRGERVALGAGREGGEQAVLARRARTRRPCRNA